MLGFDIETGERVWHMRLGGSLMSRKNALVVKGGSFYVFRVWD